MPVSAELLRQLHRIHQQLADLNDRLARGPRQIAVREANVQHQTTGLASAQQAVQQTKMTADRKQLDLKSSESKINDLKIKLNACSSNKEFHALQEQIAASEMANSVLADEILEALEKVDQLELAVVEARHQLEVAQTDLAAWRDRVAAEAAVLKADIERLSTELAEAEKQLPADFRDDYRRVIRGKGADGMAKVEDGVCQGCGQQIPINVQNLLLLGDPVRCKSCGRILYVPE